MSVLPEVIWASQARQSPSFLVGENQHPPRPRLREGQDSRGWLRGSSIELVLELPLGLDEGGAGDPLLADVQLRVLLDVIPHDLLWRAESGQRGCHPRLPGPEEEEREANHCPNQSCARGSCCLPCTRLERQGSASLGTCRDLPEPPRWLSGEATQGRDAERLGVNVGTSVEGTG